MTFRTLKADVIRRNILSTDFFAEAVTLTDGAGATSAATAKPGAEITERRQTEYGFEDVVTRDFFLELTGAVPVLVTFGTLQYAVENFTTSSEFTTLKTKRLAPVEASRESYRRRSP
ncbi:MAG: hypothetical protein WC718_19110 [Phycisphaerales bacterium]|jgi:hypothetical protein